MPLRVRIRQVRMAPLLLLLGTFGLAAVLHFEEGLRGSAAVEMHNATFGSLIEVLRADVGQGNGVEAVKDDR